MPYTFDILKLDPPTYVDIISNIKQMSLLAYATDNFRFNGPFFINYFKKENLITVDISIVKDETSSLTVEFTAGSTEDISFGTTLYNHIEYLKAIK